MLLKIDELILYLYLSLLKKVNLEQQLHNKKTTNKPLLTRLCMVLKMENGLFGTRRKR